MLLYVRLLAFVSWFAPHACVFATYFLRLIDKESNFRKTVIRGLLHISILFSSLLFSSLPSTKPNGLNRVPVVSVDITVVYD